MRKSEKRKENNRKDARINAGFITVKQYLILFAVLVAICVSYNSVFMMYTVHYPSGDPTVGGMLLVNLLFLSLIASALFGYAKRRLLGRPIRRIAEAARQIAGGDFSIRIPPIRTDGKKDEIEVLIEDFNTMVEELSSIETLKTDFIANVSHEIKTPLSVIQSYATAIQDDSLSPQERREYGKTIVDASKKLTELVTNILKLNKLESQEIPPVSKAYSLDEQLRECVLGYEELWDKKNLTLIGDKIEEVTVHCDKALLDLVWNNLISNAIRFTDAGGVIAITLQKEGNYAVVRIGDTGCGMSEETVAHMFDRFYQGDTSHSTEGNGLGLALVKRVMTLIGGELSVKSQVGEGTTITVKLRI